MRSFIDKNAQLLNLLLENNSISASSIASKASKRLFQQLEQAELVKTRKKGVGNQYQLFNREGLVNFIDSSYPSGLIKKDTSDIPRRVQGILSTKNSKSLSKLDFDLVTMRGNSSFIYDKQIVNLSKLTTENIYFSLKLTSSQTITIQDNNQILITVENPTFFTELDAMIQDHWNLAVYTGGKMSNILLKQLAQWDKAGHFLIHFGDYDYVGLLEFSRILNICVNARLYQPSKLTPEFFKQYGNSELLQKQTKHHQTLQKAILKLPKSQGKSDLVKIYNLIQDSSVGLEQESLYLF